MTVDPVLVQPRIPVDVGIKSPVLEDVGKTTNVIVATGRAEREKDHAEDPVRGAHEEGQRIKDVAATKKMTGSTIQQRIVLLRPGEVAGVMKTTDSCMPSAMPIVREK